MLYVVNQEVFTIYDFQKEIHHIRNNNSKIVLGKVRSVLIRERTKNL